MAWNEIAYSDALKHISSCSPRLDQIIWFLLFETGRNSFLTWTKKIANIWRVVESKNVKFLNVLDRHIHRMLAMMILTSQIFLYAFIFNLPWLIIFILILINTLCLNFSLFLWLPNFLLLSFIMIWYIITLWKIEDLIDKIIIINFIFLIFFTAPLREDLIYIW